jgi:hypothetical protein
MVAARGFQLDCLIFLKLSSDLNPHVYTGISLSERVPLSRPPLRVSLSERTRYRNSNNEYRLVIRTANCSDNEYSLVIGMFR